MKTQQLRQDFARDETKCLKGILRCSVGRYSGKVTPGDVSHRRGHAARRLYIDQHPADHLPAGLTVWEQFRVAMASLSPATAEP